MYLITKTNEKTNHIRSTAMDNILCHDGGSSKQLMNILIKNGTPYRFYKETDDAFLYINDKYDIIKILKQ